MAVVWTVEERCKRCYTCIRECPAKAIKVEKGQAKVVEHRCLGCGHCVRVCSQNAKAVQDGVAQTLKFLQTPGETVAMLAPSFPASYPELDPEKIVGALKACGFTRVVEVAFGADLINRTYRELIENPGKNAGAKLPVITSSCPAICEYIQKYVPELVENLAPVVSPMIAMGRVVREKYGKTARVVFIGPCTAKKVEARSPEIADAVDEVLTFREMEEIFAARQVEPAAADSADFDPPHAFLGRIYPVSGGLLRSSGLPVDIMNNEVILTEGKHRIMKLLDSIRNGEIRAGVADVLFCEGCINGPYMNHTKNYFTRKQKIVEYTESRRAATDQREWEHAMECFSELPVSREFEVQTISSPQPSESDIRKIFVQINKYSPSDELNCGACGYSSCREYALAVHQGLAEAEMCLPYLIDKYERIQNELRRSLHELAETQEQLLQSEKLASIGQLAAGVAHEVNNPLGSIILFSHLVLDEMGSGSPGSKDMRFIIEEANRCRQIVSGLLNFARQGRLKLQPTALPEIFEKLLPVISKQPLYGKIRIRQQIDPGIPQINIDPDQMYQVILNLVQNAAEAMPGGGELNMSAQMDAEKNKAVIRIRDTGCGIPAENMKKLFTPFFTTKQIGKGTGLGLPIAYGIVKMHKGNISVESEVRKGTTFTIELPAQTDMPVNTNVE